ncbi:Ferripyoverdine receptor precursor [Gammaproteobacteria bacterium MOLA455]|nr:Ferripyoverdine receptor precursor [Gammaproteobacteria bacterium MOLA455]
MLDVLWGKKINQSSIQNAQVSSAVEEEGRLTFRNAVAVLAVIFCLYTNHTTADTDDIIAFNIPQQRADLALTEFAEQANLTLVFPFDQVKDKTANRLVGHYPVEFAVTQLLQGTGLNPTFSNRLVLNIAIESKGKRMNIKNMNLRKTLLATSVGIFAAGAGAQDTVRNQEFATDQARIDEVVVTAQKREQRLIDVPISIATLDDEKLKNMGINGIDKLSYAIPNFSIRSNSETEKRFVIRGVSNVRGSSALVGVYLDEIPVSLSPQFQPNLQMLDIQRVEVLRGPQGTLYGQGSTGGTVRLLTKNPNFDGINGEIGSSFYTTKSGDTSSEVSAITNIPVIDDTLAFRVAASYKDVGGWIDQPDANNEDINDVETSYIRVKGLWQVSEDLTLNAMVMRARDDAGARGLGNILDSQGDWFYRQVERNGLPLLGTEISTHSDIYNVTLNYDLGFATLTSSTSQVEIGTDPYNSSVRVNQDPVSNAGITVTGIFNDTEGFTQEIRLQGVTSNNKMDWVVGAFYSDIDTKKGREDASVYTEGVVGSSFGSSEERETSESTAIFASIDYHLTQQLTFTAGARYFEDDRAIDGSSYAAPKSATFDHVSPAIGVSYALSNDASVYVRIAEGFRSGGFNSVAGAEDYEPETVRTYEVGAKALMLDGRLQAEAALFHSQYDDIQASDPSQQVVGRVVTLNPGEAEMQGIEWSTQLSISEQFSIGLDGHYIDTEFVKVSSVSVNEVGDPIDYTPKYSVSFNTRFDFAGPLDSAGFTALDYNVQGGSVEIASGNRRVESDTLTHLNVRLGLNWESFTAELFGRNLTDERDFNNPTNFNNYTQDRPRTWGVTVGYKF